MGLATGSFQVQKWFNFPLKSIHSGVKKRKVSENTSGDEEQGRGIPQTRVTHISKNFEHIFY